MKPCVFIHTNHKQYIGALVSQYSFKRNSPECRQVRRQHHSQQRPSVPARQRRAVVPARGRHAGVAHGGPAVLHAAPLPGAGADGLRGARGGGRSGRVRGRRRVRAAHPRHGRQGDHVPHAHRQQGRGRGSGHQRDAAGLRQAHPLAVRGAVQRAVRGQARLHGLDPAARRAQGLDRPVRGRVERFRPAGREYQAAAQHQAPDPAVEERPADRLHLGGQEGRALEAGDLAAPDQALEDRVARRPTRRIPTATRSASSSACCANAWPRAWSPRSCCARRCATTTSATTPWSWSSAPRRSRRNAAFSLRAAPTRLVARGSGRR